MHWCNWYLTLQCEPQLLFNNISNHWSGCRKSWSWAYRHWHLLIVFPQVHADLGDIENAHLFSYLFLPPRWPIRGPTSRRPSKSPRRCRPSSPPSWRGSTWRWRSSGGVGRARRTSGKSWSRWGSWRETSGKFSGVVGSIASLVSQQQSVPNSGAFFSVCSDRNLVSEECFFFISAHCI